MTNEIKRLVHPKEKFYSALMYAFGLLIWIAALAVLAYVAKEKGLIVVGVVIGELALFYLIYLTAAGFLRAYIYGHYVMVGPDQFPHLHKFVQEGASMVGLKRAPEAFVYNAGFTNAFAMRLFGKPYVMLTSAIIDADDDSQIRFVVGHELGHHAMGHLSTWRNFIKMPAHFVPFLAPAYSRARELTCDRIGAYVSQDLHASRGALQMLACGSARLNAMMNHRAFEAQEKLVPPVFGFLLHIFSHYPRHSARVAALSTYFDRVARAAQRSEPSGLDAQPSFQS